MNRFAALPIVIILTLGLVAAAQETAPGADPLMPGANQAMVRFLHAAPNAQPDQVVLSDVMGSVEIEEFAAAEYLEVTEYVPIVAGTYDVTLSLAVAEGEELDTVVVVPADTLDVFAGEFYTIALIGVQFPDATTAADDGFLAWLEDLFTADREDLSLRAMVINDLVTTVIAQHETEARIMHAAPGTEAVDLVLVRNDGATIDVLETASYGRISGFSRLAPDEGHLQVRIAGTDAVLLDLADVTLATGISHTVFVTGTPIEEVPIEALVVANPWVAAQAIPPTAPGAVTPATATLTANELEFLRQHIDGAQQRLESVEARLAALQDVDAAHDEAAAAWDEVRDARAFLEQARAQIDVVTPPIMTDPLAPPPVTDPVDDEND